MVLYQIDNNKKFIINRFQRSINKIRYKYIKSKEQKYKMKKYDK